MVKEEEEDGAGYEDRQYPFVLYNHVVLQHETNDKIPHFHIIVRIKQIAKRSNHQESWVACF